MEWAVLWKTQAMVTIYVSQELGSVLGASSVERAATEREDDEGYLRHVYSMYTPVRQLFPISRQDKPTRGYSFDVPMAFLCLHMQVRACTICTHNSQR